MTEFKRMKSSYYNYLYDMKGWFIITFNGQSLLYILNLLHKPKLGAAHKSNFMYSPLFRPLICVLKHFKEHHKYCRFTLYNVNQMTLRILSVKDHNLQNKDNMKGNACFKGKT